MEDGEGRRPRDTPSNEKQLSREQLSCVQGGYFPEEVPAHSHPSGGALVSAVCERSSAHHHLL
ncbi:sentrin-specific protease 3-like [Clarias magur]|uniref:Sentrin-specific protease 3-like n=1 Tax=Clarias magur TaxID=1594786 RepID=A0A8J4XAQ1_CLAMG|nr:sentrin-specific protease 3-like [Clarias magur]